MDSCSVTESPRSVSPEAWSPHFNIRSVQTLKSSYSAVKSLTMGCCVDGPLEIEAGAQAAGSCSVSCKAILVLDPK